ncbi:TA system VapC family ribonuclease toxin [Aquipuribacter nitratireducens]|uniref:Ribonuclease VapC n=1 Tax=Aquipuribacter nitratireducens TaxID=650104 RepID=A0ABW0GHP2_9MICO
MRALLDVNVLLALFDPDHVDHRAAQAFATGLDDGWASCPLTQNGFLRIVSQPRYPSPVPVAEAAARLAEAAADGGHEFWPDDVSLLDRTLIERRVLLGSRQITDAYLLALATRRGGRLVTFDQGISLAAVTGATEANLAVVPT